jgi:hypothetical protein
MRRQPGQFNMPSDISLDKTGKICVLDSYNYRVQVSNRTGGFLFA